MVFVYFSEEQLECFKFQQTTNTVRRTYCSDNQLESCNIFQNSGEPVKMWTWMPNTGHPCHLLLHLRKTRLIAGLDPDLGPIITV